jgi:hypothetical protein
VTDGEFLSLHPNFGKQEWAGVYVRDRNLYNLCMYIMV